MVGAGNNIRAFIQIHLFYFADEETEDWEMEWPKLFFFFKPGNSSFHCIFDMEMLQGALAKSSCTSEGMNGWAAPAGGMWRECFLPSSAV